MKVSNTFSGGYVAESAHDSTEQPAAAAYAVQTGRSLHYSLRIVLNELTGVGTQGAFRIQPILPCAAHQGEKQLTKIFFTIGKRKIVV